MLAPHLRKKVDKLWDRFWSAGLTNPLVAVEQITYLLFLKRLEDLDRERVRAGKHSVYAKRLPEDKAEFDGETCRWRYIRQESTNTRHLIEVVFPWLRTLDKRLSEHEEGTELEGLDGRMADAYFQLDPNKGQVLHDAVQLIDELFVQAGDGSAAQDLMGDAFEYLLSEVATAGKNGQFRTPRHLIRFMVELLAPRPGERLIDPAAGTGGFLFSAQQFLRRQLSAPDNVRLEWDGAPHRIDTAQASAEELERLNDGHCYVGIDNDRTMARIGWMNLVLHDVHNPQLQQGDSLSKREGKPELAPLLASESYRYVLANPPFTGTVDTADLERDPLLFPRAGTKGKKKDEVLTNKSELLFLWLMLDLLEVGGRCAVIVPEGVLFGNTDAHIKLRRELLTEHCVEAVISLPGGVFQPYTGVKTSILVFRKETPRGRKTTFEKTTPRTEWVWFYEVVADGYMPDAKRTPRPGQENDLWDALVQFARWQREGRAALEGEAHYHQPCYWRERWRQASLRDASGQLTPAGFAFADDEQAAPAFDNKTWAIHELFPELPTDPATAEAFVSERVAPRLADVAARHFAHAGKTASTKWNSAVRELQRYFEDEGLALTLWKQLCRVAQEQVPEEPNVEPLPDLVDALAPLARDVAKVDGYDLWLRSADINQARPANVRKCWTVPLRAWAVDTEWRSADGTLQGSHDATGLVRPEYVAEKQLRLYDGDTLDAALLDPDCIEARDWNLSAGQYKPFDLAEMTSDVSVTDLIEELRAFEHGILKRLDRLQAMMEGRV
ncbi:type I restriction-modification system subunit M [Pyxidicoccus xibeiensis]|uniref:type I restriction-modification system subunit M n=1 Tax=Pyxidicoccus xibeiensis TaxID=2906759 RepID=UPI0020A6F27F|nr:class I SAM-dependent DNA methyltransferase [Pyxidicoccus xibeiensis]MCP3142102.1 type I restriction-modification system subunit M [Pyxidicoccus xibeiensis]